MLNKKILFIAAISLQFAVLLGMYAKAQLPIWTGQEIRVKTIPVDPRSMFRGNYARLNYAFSRVSIQPSEKWQAARVGEVVYLSLQLNADGLYQQKSLALVKPDQGVFIRGRIIYKSNSTVRVNYGIEAYFAPKVEALRLERELRSGAVAVLMVADSGQVVLQGVETQGD